MRFEGRKSHAQSLVGEVLVLPAEHGFSLLSGGVHFFPSSEGNLASCCVMTNHIVFQLPLGSSLSSRKNSLGFLVLAIHFVLVLSQLLVVTCNFISESSLLFRETFFVCNVCSLWPSFQMSSYLPIDQLGKNDLQRTFTLFMNMNKGMQILINSSKCSFLKLGNEIIAPAELVFGPLIKLNLVSIFIKSRFY